MNKGLNQLDQPRGKPLEASRGAQPEQAAHQQAQVTTGYVNQQAFEDTRVRLPMGPTQPARLVTVGKRPLQQLAPFPQQRLAPITPNPTAIRVNHTLRANNYSAAANEDVRDFRTTIPEGQRNRISSMIFGGFSRCLPDSEI